MERLELQIPQGDNKKRLEDFLFDRFNGLSRMYLREIVKNEKCEVNGRFENVGYRLRANDFLEIELDPTRESSMVPQAIPLDIVFEDNDLVVVNKPSGMLVHPTHRDKSGTLLNALAFHINREVLTQRREDAEENETGGGGDSRSKIQNPRSEILRPGLVHRLDKHTSGLIVVAKNARTHRILADHFQRKLVHKRYLGLVEGTVEADEGIIEAPIGRFAELKRWSVKDDGKYSKTRFWVRERRSDTTLLELEPVTGRTNQLRIHCAHFGHPIVGDITRGGGQFERLCLHAAKLSFHHPNGGGIREFSSEPVGFALSNSIPI